VCVSAYNTCGTTDQSRTIRQLPDIINSFYYQVTAFTNKPLCIGEIGSTAHCGGKPEWIRDSWDKLAHRYVKVKVINWFFVSRAA
jgi:hypothetical protein